MLVGVGENDDYGTRRSLEARETERFLLANLEMQDQETGCFSSHAAFLKWSGTRVAYGTDIVTFRDYLPILLGDEMQKWIPPYQGYSETVDPRISNVFTFAFRFGHLEVPSTVSRLDENYQPWGSEPELPLHKLFFNTWRLVKDSGIDPLVRGLLAKKAKLVHQDKMMTGELHNMLFQLNHTIHGFDLAAINIQRSRDHGQPGYNSWRAFCGLSQPKTLEELSAVLRNEMLAKKLLDLYGTPDNIDIWLGAIAEPLVHRGRVGPLLTCLLGRQFQRIRDGDRQVKSLSEAGEALPLGRGPECSS
ncbi:lactoperoxidase-like [Peromyscus californicus insignis]|uniref:lactoperoxidase-like n=1 Tax=Peromyscus californicus insignis TaxID=564181 RepID=UPI0022A7BAF9|nr:lactoperoxidase-like [Peromyscus californicus insignis]